MKRYLLAWCIVLFLVASPMWAEYVRNQNAGISFEVPVNWFYQSEGDNIMVASPEGEVAIAMVVVAFDAIDAATHGAVTQLQKDFPDLSFGKTEQGTINGMEFFYTFGSATLDGEDVAVELGVLIANKHILLNSIITASGMKYEADVTAFLKSIKKF